MGDDREYMPAVGDSFRLNYGEGNQANKLIHVRAIVDDEYIVYRYWRRGEWIYKMTDPTFFSFGVENGYITKAKGKSNG